MATSFLRGKIRDKKNEAARALADEKAAQAGCVGKRKYESFEEANRNITHNTDTKLPGRLRAYKCKICHGYHIGRSMVFPIKMAEEV